jgi:hypothetical protein
MKSEEDFAQEQDLAEALKEYRAAAWEQTERSDSFWEDQRRKVMAGINRRKPLLGFKPALVWGLAAAVVLVVIGLRIEGPQALPAPDFAGGYDQDLLGDVERLIRAPMPSALEPAMILVNDIHAGAPESPNQ